MELSFVISALKRYWWLFIGAVLLGTLSGAELRGETQTSYESKALLSIAPPSVSPSTAESSSDRYVAGQLLVLSSESSAAAVAEAIGDGATAQSKYEALKKEMNRALLVERLRQEDEAREYRRQINELIENGVTVAKVESLPDGVTVYSATPVGHTESRANANAARQNEFVDQTTN